MPAFVGAVKVNSVGSSSIFHIGDVYAMSPTSSAKTFAGGGSFNTGDGLSINVDQSYTYVTDSDTFDQTIVGNA
ncbi:spore germination protein [Salinibacillus xinjiangensis]|uniref:Spore germination protein n=1 Tax=Salinibacillus xinjiangensis TaxID=1229268 RepID=A0A6G1X7Y1_9BACI|nr:spore germination protein [Salinibacillus xinjiangensis]MRG87039.1 spore germination protein [Salinibacillus xinjiangensis]